MRRKFYLAAACAVSNPPVEINKNPGFLKS